MTGSVRPATGQGDPWHAFGYIVAGVGVYGVLGWLADRWLDTRFLVAVGILAGAGMGIYMTFARFNPGGDRPDADREHDREVHNDVSEEPK